jgi:hypothetical protein
LETFYFFEPKKVNKLKIFILFPSLLLLVLPALAAAAAKAAGERGGFALATKRKRREYNSNLHLLRQGVFNSKTSTLLFKNKRSS